MSDKIYFDSCVFLAWLKNETGRVEIVSRLFAHAKDGRLSIVTSTLTFAEVLNIQGFKSPIPKEQRDKVKSLFKNEWIIPKGVSSKVAEIARELVWEYDVQPKDGIHVATTMIFEVPKLYTYDDKLTKLNILRVEGYKPVEILEPVPPEQGELDLNKPKN